MAHEPKIPTAVAQAEREAMAQLEAAQREDASGNPPEQPAEQPEEQDQNSHEPEQPRGLEIPGFEAEVQAHGQPETGPLGGDAEQRYRVLKGKYDAEVPALHQHIGHLKGQLANSEAHVAQLQGALNTLQALLKSRQPDADALPQGATDGTTQADVEYTDDQLKELVGDAAALEEFGPDFFRTLAKFNRRMQRRAQDAPDVQEQRMALDELRAERDRARQERLESNLTRILPDWQTQNNDPRFVAWLRDTSEPRTGVAYLQLLDNAITAGNAGAVARIFGDWPEAAQGPVAPAAPRVAQPVPIGRQVTVRPGAPQGQKPQSKRIWTQAEVSQAYTAITKKEITGDRALALIAEIDAAYTENRVR